MDTDRVGSSGNGAANANTCGRGKSGLSKTPSGKEQTLKSKFCASPAPTNRTLRSLAPTKFKNPSENISGVLLSRFEEEVDEETSLNVPHVPLVNQVVVPVFHSKKGGAPKTWGPIVAPRMSSRIQRDGRNAIQKVAALKMSQNMEIPKPGTYESFSQNSFVVLANDNLLGKARDSGISLGNDDASIQHNIATIKSIECDRIDQRK